MNYTDPLALTWDGYNTLAQNLLDLGLEPSDARRFDRDWGSRQGVMMGPTTLTGTVPTRGQADGAYGRQIASIPPYRNGVYIKRGTPTGNQDVAFHEWRHRGSTVPVDEEYAMRQQDAQHSSGAYNKQQAALYLERARRESTPEAIRDKQAASDTYQQQLNAHQQGVENRQVLRHPSLSSTGLIEGRMQAIRDEYKDPLNNVPRGPTARLTMPQDSRQVPPYREPPAPAPRPAAPTSQPRVAQLADTQRQLITPNWGSARNEFNPLNNVPRGPTARLVMDRQQAPTPTPQQPVVVPTPQQPVVAPTPQQPVVAPTPQQPVVAPTPQPRVAQPAAPTPSPVQRPAPTQELGFKEADAARKLYADPAAARQQAVRDGQLQQTTRADGAQVWSTSRQPPSSVVKT